MNPAIISIILFIIFKNKILLDWVDIEYSFISCNCLYYILIKKNKNIIQTNINDSLAQCLSKNQIKNLLFSHDSNVCKCHLMLRKHFFPSFTDVFRFILHIEKVNINLRVNQTVLLKLFVSLYVSIYKYTENTDI